jgi:hypothetical protein
MLSIISPSGVVSLGFKKSRHLLRHQAVFGGTALLMATWLTTSVAFATQVEPSDYARLLEEANATGAVAIMVGLNVPSTLTRDIAAMEEKAKTLLSELGENVFDASYWNNGLGQVGFYVTANGLQILVNSANAKTFMPDATSKSRFRVYDSDGSLDAIDDAINATGFADVEVFLNVDEGDYDIGRDGKTTFWPSPGLSNQIMTRLNSITAQGFATGFKNLDTSPSQAAVPSPSFRVRIDRNAFYGLRVNSDVRAIRPIDFVDARPAQWPNDILVEAQIGGSTEVIISLRGGTIFSPKTGYMSATALKAQADANQRAFDDVLSSAGVSLSSLTVATYFNLGSVVATLSHDTLARLYENADPRILSIEMNRPVAWTTVQPIMESEVPAERCFSQSEAQGGLNQLTFDHYLILAAADQFKNGDVFVGFRLRSRLDLLWLSQSGGIWSTYNADPVAYYSGELQPIMRTSIIPQPMDLTMFSGDGELLVGYGLRNSAAATVKDSFQDMVSNQRYRVVWVIGAALETTGLICPTTTETVTNGNDISVTQ